MGKKRHEAKRRDSVLKEVAALGKKVEGALEAAAKSQSLRGIPNELSKGVRHVGSKLVSAVEAAAKSEQSKEIREQMKKVLKVGQKKGLEASENMRSNLASGLKAIGAELSKLAQKLDKGK